MQALHGDCLLLHYGDTNNPKIIVIDGGPSSVYRDFLKPRLKDIKAKISPTKTLPLSMVMVSHLDDDHVNGIIELTQDMINGTNFITNNFWVNTFDNIIGNIQLPVVSSLAASASSIDPMAISPFFQGKDEHYTAVIASVSQGRELQGNIKTIRALDNNPFNGLVSSEANLNPIKWDNDMEIIVVHPTIKRLTKLQKIWDKALIKAKDKGDKTIVFASLIKPDQSVYNLTSIVCLVKSNDKTMLLTGDSLDKEVLEGLKEAKLLTDGKLHVNILKIPHHGSIRNASEAFYKAVTADHYVISANGKHDNPDISTLELIEKATEGNDNFTIHLTNFEGENNLKEKLEAFITHIRARGRTFNINFRQPTKTSIMLDLLNNVNY
jgi:hypothetical protein